MRLRFQEKWPEAGDIWTFSFVPEEPVIWLAGQSIRIEVPTDWGTSERRFSISSAPYERIIAITTRLSGSDFKHALNALKPGDNINGYAIEGSFIWTDTPFKRAFISSGIGSTPFHALIKQQIYKREPINALHLYTYPDQAMAFADDIVHWQQQDVTFRAQYLGERLSAEHVHASIPDMSQWLIYLSGAQRTVDAIGLALIHEYGLPEAQLKTDSFTGRLPQDS